ncbi:serine hydrolase [Pseudogracilibacillus auburnensis]|uniref:serine hydrolase n=1 Tax=Pseudogracilibacillus auburnensis TaxID=1494959 RepID=UPI001A96045B|nr:serine hydrolase [Pseudogracilibacillus auburnensis]MBO1001363.1 serine hydrolase [Pseudogracilibacillus auburnensis]
MVKYLTIFGVIIGLIIISIIGLGFWLNKANAHYVWKKIKDEKMTSSVVFNVNGETKLDVRSDELMPLASTVKIVVALEYAYQVEEGKLDPKEQVDLDELEKYYVPKLDGGAHEAWVGFLGENDYLENNRVSLQEVTRGMIAFSSNANTEYLMKKLGLENIEHRMLELGIRDHTPLFYFTSALFIPYELKMRDYPDKSIEEGKDKIIQAMHDMSDEDWIEMSSIINEKLTNDAETYKKNAEISEWWDEDFDLLFSETFIKSTTSEYAKLMAMINNEELPPIAQEELEYSLGMIMENETNQQWLKRAGKKGGSTQYILTDAIFAEDKQGNKFEIVIFFDDLKWYEGFKLTNSLNEFELKLLSDESFRDEIL